MKRPLDRSLNHNRASEFRQSLLGPLRFAEAAGGLWCYGCPRGGPIYDLASLLHGPWGKELRDNAFLRAPELATATV